MKQNNFLAEQKPFVYDDFDILKIGNLRFLFSRIDRVCRICRRVRPHGFDVIDIIDAVDFTDLVEMVDCIETDIGKVDNVERFDKVENTLAKQFFNRKEVELHERLNKENP